MNLPASCSEASRPRSWLGGFWGVFLIHNRLESSVEPRDLWPGVGWLEIHREQVWFGRHVTRGLATAGQQRSGPPGGHPHGSLHAGTRWTRGLSLGLGAACPSPRALRSSGEARWTGHWFQPHVWAGLGLAHRPQPQSCSEPCTCVRGGNKRPGARWTCPPGT